MATLEAPSTPRRLSLSARDSGIVTSVNDLSVLRDLAIFVGLANPVVALAH